MNKANRIFCIDILQWSGIFCAVIVFIILAILTPQDWDAVKISFVVCVPLGILIIAGFAIYREYTRLPDYYDSDHDVYIWITGISCSKDYLIQNTIDAIEFFKYNFLKLYSGDRDINQEDIDRALQNMTVEWKNDVKIKMQPVNGFQLENIVVVRYMGTINRSALFHEFLHLIDWKIYGKIDLNHLAADWFEVANKMKERYRG